MHKPTASKPRSLVEGVRIALDEMFCALEECIAGLTSDQVWAHPIDRRHSIGMIVLHVQENIDRHARYFQVGRWALEHDARFEFYGKPVEDFMDLEDLPEIDVLRERTGKVRDAVLETSEGVEDETLYTPRHSEQTYWWQRHQRVSIDAYHRVVWHANAHIRQIWCLRGAMGAFGPDFFPRQFWH
ncbi:hypothetical protein JW916_05190 [Candidatus Sumerlaeota bacterium]|nr:hypothetical protein [Candidatus Sumerlaeota bacterium]